MTSRAAKRRAKLSSEMCIVHLSRTHSSLGGFAFPSFATLPRDFLFRCVRLHEISEGMVLQANAAVFRSGASKVSLCDIFLEDVISIFPPHSTGYPIYFDMYCCTFLPKEMPSTRAYVMVDFFAAFFSGCRAFD